MEQRKRHCTLVETAEQLNVPEATLRYWVTRDTARGESKEAPKSFRLGRRRMFAQEAIDEFIAARMAEASA